MADASVLAREVLSRRQQADHDPKVPRRRSTGSGHGMLISDAEDVFHWAQGRIAELEHEQAWVLVINRQRRLIRATRVSEGSVGTQSIDPERVVRVANVPRGAGFILVHNHPSDISKPAQIDIETTQQIQQLARQHRLRMLDSVVVGRTSHTSMADQGLLRAA
jgi:DNA repair protein RadC